MNIYPLDYVALHLRTDEKQVRRLIAQGELSAVRVKSRLFVPKDKLRQFEWKTCCYDLIKKECDDYAIKEAYVLRKHGASGWLLREILGQSAPRRNYCLDRYSDLRKRPLRSLGVSDFDKYFLVSEVAARLRIKDPHVIGRMMNFGLLEAKVMDRGDQTKNIVLADSFRNFLNRDKKQRYYTSKEVSEKLDLSVNRIDKVAKYCNIGRKILETKNSHYVFTKSDVGELKKGNKDMRLNGIDYIRSL